MYTRTSVVTKNAEQRPDPGDDGLEAKPDDIVSRRAGE